MEEDAEPVGPFITVVSVGGGLQCGNKLTVITPTEIGDSPITKGRNETNSNFHNLKPSKLPSSSIKGKISAIPTLVGVDRKPQSNGNNINNNSNSTTSTENVSEAAAYVTVVSLSERQKDCNAQATSKATIKSGIPVKAQKNHINTKSIVRFGSDTDTLKSTAPKSVELESNQIVTISNKVKGTAQSRQNDKQIQNSHGRNSSITEISKETHTDQDYCREENKSVNNSKEEIKKGDDGKSCRGSYENLLLLSEIATEITEQVTVYRLPGERLGFGLRFEEGVTSETNNVGLRLFIQSCAVDSPSIKADTTWGHLSGGDEIIEIESLRVKDMTRIDCIQSLKDSVALRLIVKHIYTEEELSLLRAQREIAIAKLETPNKRKDGNSIQNESEKISKKDYQQQSINNENDSLDSVNTTTRRVYSDSLNQQITNSTIINEKEITITNQTSRIPVTKSKQTGHCNIKHNYDDNNSNININDIISNEEQTENMLDNEISEALGLQRGNNDEQQQNLRLVKPPMDFADELLPQCYQDQSSISDLDGSSAKKSGIASSNNSSFAKQQPSEPQFYLNAISPTHIHRMSSMSFESNFSGLDSDETGSSRSTVVSRLSMTSSINSMSTTFGLSNDNLMTTNTANGNNGSFNSNTPHNNITFTKRKSSLTSVNTYPEEIGFDLANSNVKADFSNQSEPYQKQNDISHHREQSENQSETEIHISKQQNQHPVVVQYDRNNVSTIPCILGDADVRVNVDGVNLKSGIAYPNGTTLIPTSSSEIPLAPPLFFQDEQRVTMNTVDGQSRSLLKMTQIQQQETHVVNGNIVNISKENLGEVSHSRGKELASKGDKSRDEIGQAENANEEVRSAATNWEQKGISEYYDDDDELALLAEELGLDQEDEDLFNTLVAEIDEISAEVGGGNSVNNNNRMRSEADELIQETFNGIHFKGRENSQINQLQQQDQLCPTSIPTSNEYYEQKGDETRDAKQQSSHNDGRQKNASCDKSEQLQRSSGVASTIKALESGNYSRRLSGHEDFIQDSKSVWTTNGDMLNGNCSNSLSNNDRLVSPFSKVVEPINSQIIMTGKSRSAELQHDQERSQMKITSANQIHQWKHEKGSSSSLLGNATDKNEDVVDSTLKTNTEVTCVQAPAPPPRTKGILKQHTAEKKDANSEIKSSGNKGERPASATIVRIETWKDSREGGSQITPIKLEVRRYNSLTLPFSDKKNPEEAAIVSRKKRDDDNRSGDVDADETNRIDDSSHKDGNLVTLTTKQGSQLERSESISQERMESSTELLHQFAPPTFSRLPPDGDEFPNSCWSDEKAGKKYFRSEFAIKSSSLSSSSDLGSPPPLPTSEPPKEDPPFFEEISAPPLPTSVPPPVPHKKMAATRRCSFDDRKRLFESSSREVNNTLPKIKNETTNGFNSPSNKPSSEEPSKKSVRDKIAMFSSRSSSSEDSTDASTTTIFAKPMAPSVSSSLSKSTMNISNSQTENSLSKSSENLLGSIPPSSGRKGSVDLTSNGYASSGVRPGGVTSYNGNSNPIYGTSNGKQETFSNSKAPSLYERSQSMIDVAANMNNASYQNPISQVQAYNSVHKYNNNNNTLGRPVSTIMEQRRKCITKLRGLVIPDASNASDVAGNGNKTSASVMDLPTIISKDTSILSPKTSYDSKPPVSNASWQLKTHISRTESLDRFSSMSETNGYPNHNNTLSAKSNDIHDNNETGDWKLPNALPKYSPAFKRRGFSTYNQSSIASTATSNAKNTPTNATPTKYTKLGANFTPEPKSLESLTSPRSDSSFEFSSPSPDKSGGEIKQIEKSIEKSVEVTVSDEQSKNKLTNGKYSTGKSSGKLEDSDNDSAVSSSRSSISHGLSPPNSPTPDESAAATPDPDSRDEKSQESMNLEESWRVLKPSSIESINRKNVLKSAKFSSGAGQTGQSDTGNGTDDSSLSSNNGKNRRSDDEEASYADAETEDTESSCSELDVPGNRRRMIVAGRVNMDHGDSKADTEDDEEIEIQQSAVNMEFTELTESPLQAIYDMEVKMAYINEVCEALNDRGRSELSSRYFSRRDSEATVIERPIETKRKMSVDAVDNNSAAERRARNRSSSGNESDFSSNVSIGSQQNNHKSLSREHSNNTTVDSDRWSMLEKKYSRSMTSVNSIGSKGEPQTPQQPTLTPATSVPKIVTSASEVVEKKIERIIEKTTIDTAKKTTANIPRGRNNFKSISEKWQLIEKSSDIKTKPAISEKPILSPQNSISPVKSQSSIPSKTLSVESKRDEVIPPPISRQTAPSKSSIEAVDADRAWAEKRRSDGNEKQHKNDPMIPMNSTKRSVSVNDIRKAFEKAEIAMNYGREEDGSGSPSDAKKDTNGGLTLPAAHFRVSSFDSTTSEESSATTPAGLYGSSNSLVSSAPRDPYGSITSLASSTSLISPQELQQLIDEANQSLEEAGTPLHEVSVLILHREFASGSLGITLAGGADYETKEITVHKVLTASIADRDGRIFRGDRILSINGKSTKGLTHREALNLLKSPRTEVVLVISRGRQLPNGFQTIEETSALDRAIEPLLNGNLVIENDDDTCYKWGPLKTAKLIKDGAGLGFSLEGGKGSILGDKPLTVKKIFIGGPAEKSGELRVGDLIVSINSINMSTKSRTEAWNFMKKLNDGDVKICVRSPLA